MGDLNVCMISKYPPIQGGMASMAYWLSQGLSEAGVSVTVVTNANRVEEDYRINDGMVEDGPMLNVRYVSEDLPWHIPDSPLYLARLVETTLQVCRQRKVDLIDAHYLVPYGMAAFLVNRITGVPYVLRHGGSDVGKFLSDGFFPNLLDITLSEARITVTDRKEIKAKTSRWVSMPKYVPAPAFSSPGFSTIRPITIGYVGKINYYWRHKSLDKITRLLRTVSGEMRVIFLAQGKGLADFADNCDLTGIDFRNFIPPWEMPEFMREIDYLVYFCRDNPMPDRPNIIPEALESGVKVLTDSPEFFQQFLEQYDLNGRILDVSSFVDNTDGFADFLRQNITPRKPKSGSRPDRYAKYIQDNILLYRDACGMK